MFPFGFVYSMGGLSRLLLLVAYFQIYATLITFRKSTHL
jgi:hypothetical protein